MMIAVRKRASAVLFDFLRSIRADGVFLLPANVCPIVPIVLMKARRPFEFIDIDAKSLGMSEVEAFRRLQRTGKRVAGVLYVRPYGAVADVSDFFLTLKAMQPDLVLVDDRCLAPPAIVPPVPQIADLVLYSTGYSKYVDLGFGGYGFLKELPDEAEHAVDGFEVADLAAITEDYKAAIRLGQAFRYRDCRWLDQSALDMSADAYLSVAADALRKADRQKQCLNDIYASRLPSEIQLPREFQSWRFNVVVPNKQELLQTIEREGLFASSHYAALDGLLGPGTGAVARRLHGRIINFFNDLRFDERRALQISRLTVDHLARCA